MPEESNPPAISQPGGEAEAPTAYTEAAARFVARPPGASVPFQVGRYRVVCLIGEGGMGAVYQAEQDHPRRTVALKLIKAGLASPSLLRRFKDEAEVLGRLQHPGIAQIYEAGTAETGAGPQPFFAMEFVAGRPLTSFAAGLGVRERLELLARVCDAVHHAHQRGIIHRDLKPANILVDQTGQPKVLDFGVARVTDSDAQVTRQTDIGQIIGTLAYMSPEQVLADPLEIDIRTDVYALGLILYELLAGRLPYTTERARIHEAVEAICEQEAPALGTIDRAYRGDIETIVAKAIEKDKTRRYSSAAELAADIRRFLNDEAIVARPATTIYKLQKFARRHRTLVAALATVFLVLVAGVFASTWQAIRAKRAELSARQSESQARSQRDRATAAEAVSIRERDAATQERDRATRTEAEARQQRDQTLAEKRRADEGAATARAVNEFLQRDLLAQADSGSQTSAKPDPDIKVRALLDRAAERISGRFGDRPRVEASIEATIGRAYWGLGLFPEAERHLSRALTTFTAANGPLHPETLDTAERLGDLYRAMGRYADAESLLEKTADGLRRTLGSGNPLTLRALSGLAGVYVAAGKNQKAAPLLAELLELERRTLGPEHETTVDTMNELARLQFVSGNLAGAESLLREAIDINRRSLGPDHPRTLPPMNRLAVAVQVQSQDAEAEALHTPLLDVRRRVLGPNHPDTFNTMNNLGALDTDQGKFVEAEALYLQVLEGWRKQYGPEHPRVLTLLSNLANTYRAEGKNAQAESTCAQVLEARRRVLGPEHPDTLDSMHNLAVTYAAEQKYAEAETLFGQALEGRRRVLGPRHARTTDTMESWGETRIRAGKYAEAEPLLRECLAIQTQAAPDGHARFHTESLLGQSLLHQAKYAEAEPLLLSGYAGLTQREARMPAVRRRAIGEAGQAIVALYEPGGKRAEAARWEADGADVPSGRQ